MLLKNKCKFACIIILLIVCCSAISTKANVINSFNNIQNTQELDLLNFNKSKIKKTIINIANESYAIKYPIITEAEKKTLGNTFENEDIYLRLDRLEQKIFSTSFSKENLSDRVDRIREKTQYDNKIVSTDQDEYLSKSEEINKEMDSQDNVLTKLFDAEINVLGSSFEDDSPDKRLERLEKVIFGYKQNGTIQSRINQAYEISKTSFNRYNNSDNQDKYNYESYNPPKAKAIDLNKEGYYKSDYNNNNQQKYSAQNDITPIIQSFYDQGYSTNDNSYSSQSYNTQTQGSGIIETLKQVAYPFAMYFLSKSNAANYIPGELVNQVFGNPNYYNYQSYPGTYYQSYPGNQYNQQNQYNYGNGIKILPY